MKEILIASIPSIISAFITFFFTRRKYQAEVQKANVETDTNEIDNIEKAARIWRQLSEDITARLTSDINQLRTENQRTREKLNALTRENNALRSQMASLQKELRSTKIENEKLTEQLRQFNQHFVTSPSSL